jgi:peptidoglycan/xylan/chitin deacetylase (PgdA/CDA1 family)
VGRRACTADSCQYRTRVGPRPILDAAKAALVLVDQMARRNRVGMVLLYHRIAPVAGDPSRELVPAVSVSTFRRQMRWLRLFFRVVPASSLPAAIAKRRFWQRFPISIAFDDENPEHCEWVLPVLKETGVGATFFLTGLCLDGPRAAWWELLQGAVDADLPLDPLLGGGDIHTRAERVKMMQPQERDDVVRELEKMGARAPNRAMTPDELVAIASEHAIGFHTRGHDFLPVLPPADLDRALNEGRKPLESILGRPMDLVAYPHGGAGEREALAAARAGYRLGFTTSQQGWSPTMDPLRIGRIDVGEEPPGSLARRLAGVVARDSDPGD